MKLKGLVKIAALSAMLITTCAQADTLLFSRLFSKGDLCDQIAGHWEGNGTVRKSVVTCNYAGSGNIQRTGPGQFSMDIALTKTSGICPAGEQFHFTGSCENSLLRLKTPDADLKGDLTNNNGILAVDNINGKIWLNVVGVRTSVDVEMAIHKTN